MPPAPSSHQFSLCTSHRESDATSGASCAFRTVTLSSPIVALTAIRNATHVMFSCQILHFTRKLADKPCASLLHPCELFFLMRWDPAVSEIPSTRHLDLHFFRLQVSGYRSDPIYQVPQLNIPPVGSLLYSPNLSCAVHLYSIATLNRILNRKRHLFFISSELLCTPDWL